MKVSLSFVVDIFPFLPIGKKFILIPLGLPMKVTYGVVEPKAHFPVFILDELAESVWFPSCLTGYFTGDSSSLHLFMDTSRAQPVELGFSHRESHLVSCYSCWPLSHYKLTLDISSQTDSAIDCTSQHFCLPMSKTKFQVFLSHWFSMHSLASQLRTVSFFRYL